MAAILPSDIEYRQFSDEQFEGFASAAGLEYQNPDLSWQDDLNDVARDFLFDYAAMDYPTPSAMRKQLQIVLRDPDHFVQRMAVEPALSDSPLATAILHGTRWRREKLATVENHRDEFIAGVNREIVLLGVIIKWRKDNKATGNGGNPAIDQFIERLTWVFQQAFWQDVNVGLSVPSSSRKLNWDAEPSGPFINFTKSVAKAIVSNLSTASGNSGVAVSLRGLSISGSAIRNRLAKSENYKLASNLRREAKI